jgi:hypothetical protein
MIQQGIVSALQAQPDLLALAEQLTDSEEKN